MTEIVMLDLVAVKLSNRSHAGAGIAGVPASAAVPIVACALAGGSELFVTGDRALRDLGDVRGLSIVSPRDAWARLFAAA